MRGLHKLEHFLVDDLGGSRGVLVGERAEIALLVVGPLDGAKLLGEAVVEHHLTRDVRGLFDIVGSTGGRVVEHDLFGGTAAHGVRHLIEQLVAGHGVTVLGWHDRGVAQCTAARQNRHLGHRIGVVHGGRDQRMATLVICGVA